MRNRLEDLGRLAVLLEDLLGHPLFDPDLLPIRSGDFSKWVKNFKDLPIDIQHDVVRELMCNIRDLKMLLEDHCPQSIVLI